MTSEQEGRSSGSSSAMSNSTGDNTQVPKDNVKKQALKYGKIKTAFSPSECPHSKQVSSQFLA
jgi:hypothetical protein